MNKDTFAKGFGLLCETFSKQINTAIAYESLKDLDDAAFARAVGYIIKNTTELYPGSNLIAMVRQQALEENKKLHKEREVESRSRALIYEEVVPPPEEFKAMMNKLKSAIGY